MTRYGMLINLKKCVGCYTCVEACQRQNNLVPAEQFIRFEEKETGNAPNLHVETVPMQCMHCEDAPCVSVCPTGASHFAPGGIVAVDEGRCIGCKYCMVACPYQVRVVNEEQGTVEKCRFCTVSALDGTKMCTCVEACPTGARMFGDLDDADSDISQEIAKTNAQPIAGSLTKAKIFYVR